MKQEAIKFFIYCIEIYRRAKGITGQEALKIFDTYGVTDFILDCYEALHCEGSNATVYEIDEFIAHHPIENELQPT